MMYHTILKAQIGYSVGTTLLNKKELGKIDTEETHSIHPKNRAQQETSLHNDQWSPRNV